MKYNQMERTMNIVEELKLENLSKPIEEMDHVEAKAALKVVKANIKKLEKAITKYQNQIAAAELKEKVAATKATKPAKATADKPIVKASNKGDGSLKPTATIKTGNTPVAKKSTAPVSAKMTTKKG